MVNNKNNKSGKMTIDKLALMVAKGFEQTAEDLKGMATKEDLKKVEDKLIYRINGLEKRIDDYALNKVSYDNFNPLVKRVEKLEGKV